MEGFINKGKDMRIGIVNKMDEHPYNSLILLYTVIDNRKFGIGTAFQINAEFASTAAHNLWNGEDYRLLKNLRLFPAAAGTIDTSKNIANEVRV